VLLDVTDRPRYSPIDIDFGGGQPTTGGELPTTSGGQPATGGELPATGDELGDPGPEQAWINALLAAEARAAARLSAEEMFGRGFLRLRLYLGWSQKAVERRSGVDQSTISRLETGHAANIGSARICRLLRALQVGDVVFLPRLPTLEPTALELMLRGDPWKRALAEADRRINRRRSA
jgi:transcriptional regulator with XRE-family HTH domain